MNYKEARTKALNKRIIGLLISAPAVVSTVISFLKMIYFRLDDGSRFGAAIARPFKQGVSWVYENTQLFNLFWENSPTPNHMNLKEIHNLYFIVIYLSVFLGLAFYSSGKKLSARLNKIDEKIENQMIEESIKGEGARNREEIENTTNIPSSSIFNQIHQLYFAPIAGAIVAAIVINLAGI